MRNLRRIGSVAAACCSIMLVPSAIGAGGSAAAEPGTIIAASFRSATLGEDVAYNVYLPAGYATSGNREEVAGDDARRLRAEKLAPGRPLVDVQSAGGSDPTSHRDRSAPAAAAGRSTDR
jgi:hypothetical protein